MVEVKLPRCLLVLTEAELVSLLALDREIWAKALERGKVVQRARQRAARAIKTVEGGKGTNEGVQSDEGSD